MSLVRYITIWKRALSRGVFPHQFWWVLELGWRRIVLSPEVLASRLPVHADALVLEIGAGSGYYTTEVARRLKNGKVTVCDIQVEMLERCRKKCGSAGLANVAYAVGDAAALPFADAGFDVVYMVTVFGEVVDQDASLRGIRRLLKPGGHAFDQRAPPGSGLHVAARFTATRRACGAHLRGAPRIAMGVHGNLPRASRAS